MRLLLSMGSIDRSSTGPSATSGYPRGGTQVTAGRQPVSNTKDWCTPPAIVDSVRKCFGGSIELAAFSDQGAVVSLAGVALPPGQPT